jgi:hypothetical protein
MKLRYGKKAPLVTPHTWRSMAAMKAVLDPLGVPPTNSNDYLSAVKVPWNMYLNDQLGCCVCADTAHTTMLRTANASQIIVPTDNDVLKLYETVGRYVPGDSRTDNGCVETNMCWYLQRTGFLGQKLDEFSSLDPHNLSHIKWAIQLFGSVRIGFEVPAYCMDQFNNGKPWDVSPFGDQSIDGGHDVPLVGYQGDTLLCITWGKVQQMTPAFLAKYCDEIHVELAYDWVRAQGQSPSGFDLSTLDSKMMELRA